MRNKFLTTQSLTIFRKLVLVSVIISLVTLSTTTAFSAGKHACDYLTKDEVSKILGAPIGNVESQPANPMGQSTCFFDISAGMAMRFAQLQMVRTGWAKRGGKNFRAPTLFENNMSFLTNLQEIPGVGEKAYWGGSGMKLGAGLHILYKNAYFTVQAATGDQDKNLVKAKELASVIMKKVK